MSDETALTVPAETNLRLVALDPAQLQRSQQLMISWAAQKLAHVVRDVEDARVNLDIAKKSKWNTDRPKKALKRAEDSYLYYGKIKAALEAGYYIVPDFPCDIFAIRTERDVPRSNTKYSTHPSNYAMVPDETSQILPIGEGEYQNPSQNVDRLDASYKDTSGEDVTRYRYNAATFTKIDFPFTLAKPQILDAAQRAMALKIFDELAAAPAGIVRSNKPDPMVLGIIKMPKRWYSQRKLTFLIAWFLDTETL